ncbi:MAG: 4Fe-4S binding protein, partial [Deltaproteobacteria bacterium]|nr:4Fe-4S binding protein [Deltaproteobacteria bacterium]
RRTAYTPHAQACKACGLCVTACPEHAITLELAAPSARSGTDE